MFVVCVRSLCVSGDERHGSAAADSREGLHDACYRGHCKHDAAGCQPVSQPRFLGIPQQTVQKGNGQKQDQRAARGGCGSGGGRSHCCCAVCSCCPCCSCSSFCCSL